MPITRWVPVLVAAVAVGFGAGFLIHHSSGKSATGSTAAGAATDLPRVPAAAAPVRVSAVLGRVAAVPGLAQPRRPGGKAPATPAPTSPSVTGSSNAAPVTPSPVAPTPVTPRHTSPAPARPRPSSGGSSGGGGDEG
jgi:hypothetical protein